MTPGPTDDRYTSLERHVRELERRVAQLEVELTEKHSSASVEPSPQAPSTFPPLPQPRSEPAPRAARPQAVRSPLTAARTLDVEDLLGGRLLALAGGVAVLVGVAFFVAFAISRGWIDESTRIALAFAGASALLAVGVFLHERHGRTQAALAAVGTAVAALYLTLTAATQLYGLIPAPLALLVALAIGGVATATAIRFDSREIAGLGILGALLAPALVEAGTANAAVAFMGVALASSVAVLIWRRWNWLALAAFAVTVPQLLDWVTGAASATAVTAVLAVFWALYATAAIGYELRVPTSTLRRSSTLLLALDALVVAGFGYRALESLVSSAAGDAWVAAVGAAHVGLGLAAVRSSRVSRDIGLASIVVGVALADTAFGLAVGGAALPVGWAVSAVAFGAVARVRRDEGLAGRRDDTLAGLGLGAHLVLAIAHLLLFDASLDDLLRGGSEPGAVAGLIAITASALTGARLVNDDPERARGARDVSPRQGLDVVGLLALGSLSAYVLSGSPLVLAYVAEACTLAAIARRLDDRLALAGSVAFLGAAAGHVLAFEAPPDALVFGVEYLTAAAVAVAAVCGGALTCSRQVPARDPRLRSALEGAAATAAVYLPSIAIVTVFQPDWLGADAGLLDVGVRQQGQVLLSGLWSVTGLGALTIGLLRDDRRLRLGGFALLGLALAKVFVYDLQALDSLYRVLSFVALGLLLLAGAFAYQRMRPYGAGANEAPRADLREATEP